MSDIEYAAFLELLMLNDPYPLDSISHELMIYVANRLALERGFKNWMKAFYDPVLSEGLIKYKAVSLRND